MFNLFTNKSNKPKVKVSERTLFTIKVVLKKTILFLEACDVQYAVVPNGKILHDSDNAQLKVTKGPILNHNIA